MPLKNFPHVRPTPMLLPTKDYPWLRQLMKEVDFACATCSSAQGQPVYYTLEEAHREPLSSSAKTHHAGLITAKGMVATRFLVLCPTCRTVPENNPLMPGGFCELMDIDKNYKRPFRAQGSGGDGLSYDDDDSGDSPPAHPEGAWEVRIEASQEDVGPERTVRDPEADRSPEEGHKAGPGLECRSGSRQRRRVGERAGQEPQEEVGGRAAFPPATGGRPARRECPNHRS